MSPDSEQRLAQAIATARRAPLLAGMGDAVRAGG